MTIVTQPDGRAILVTEKGQATVELQNFFDDITLESRITNLTSFTVADLPSADPEAQLVFVTDEVGGAVPAFSSGSNWLRVTDRAIVSNGG